MYYNDYIGNKRNYGKNADCSIYYKYSIPREKSK